MVLANLIDFLAKNWIFKVLNMRTLFLRYTVPFRIQCWIRICKKNTCFHMKIPRYLQIKFDYEKICLLKLVGRKNGLIFYWIFFSIWSIWKWIGSMHVDFFFLTKTQDNGEKLLKNGQNKAYFCSVGPHLIKGLDIFFLAFSQSHILILKCLNGFFEF